MASTPSHPSIAPNSAVAAATIFIFLSGAAITWAAYEEGKRRGQLERAQIADDSSGRGGDAPRSKANEGDDGKPATSASRDGSVRRDDKESEVGSGGSASSLPPSLAPLPIHPIGTLRSVYRLCVGTPRQGMLVPHSRGVVTFDETRVSADSVLELRHYSHVFVVFAFHLNSNGRVREDTFGDRTCGGNGGKARGDARSRAGSRRQFPSKIAPPSLGGKKVGVFSTRTPHRPNPIGFSLCRLDDVVVHKEKKKKGGEGTFSLLLSGLDIVDGTPILDIKPYVPHYDCVGYRPSLAAAADIVRVPHWVESGLQKRRSVTFLPAADQFLQHLASVESTEQSTTLTTRPSATQLQFYGPHSPWREPPEQASDHIRRCILELLGADVRSAWQTKKARRGKFQAERSSRLRGWAGDGGGGPDARDGADRREGRDANSGLCTQQVDNLLVRYMTEEPGSAVTQEGTEGSSQNGNRPVIDERSMGSGAEDIVVVHSISIIK